MAALINPLGADAGRETVTLINTTEAAIALAGWTLADNAGRQPLEGTIEPGAALQVMLGNEVQLSNQRDTLSLRDPRGALVHQVSYEPGEVPAPGHSLVF